MDSEKINSETKALDYISKIIRRARIAGDRWKRLSFTERGSYFRKLKSIIIERSDKLARVIASVTGKPIVEALAAEVLPSMIATDYYSKNTEKLLAPRRVKRSSIVFFNKVATVVREPYGVVGIISPWNYPFWIPFHEVVMGLMSGNAIILKVSSKSEPVGDLIDEMFKSAAFPEGIFNLVKIPGKLAGKAFIDGGVNKLFFTGSVATGSFIAGYAGKKLIPVSLELGGNDAMIVLEDANLERAANGAVWAGFTNAGQSCGGIERIYVVRDVYDEFKEILEKKVNGLRQGVYDRFDVDISSISSKKQYEKIKEHVEDAISKGAIPLNGRNNTEPFRDSLFNEKLFYPPTILENVNNKMKVVIEETFGPVITLTRVDSVEEAIKLANESYLGLTASLWTRNRKRAMKLAGLLEVGVVSVNDHLMSHGMPELPWGGYKKSGYGRTHGEWGLDEMTQVKVIVDDRLPWVQREPWWFPYNDKLYKQLKNTLVFLSGIRFGKKWFLSIPETIRLVLRMFQKEKNG